MTDFLPTGEQISDTCRANPRLSLVYGPGEQRFSKYASAILNESEDPFREAHDALFYLWRFIRNMHEQCSPQTGASSLNGLRNPSSEPASAPNQRKPTCAESCADDLATSHPCWPYVVTTSPATSCPASKCGESECEQMAAEVAHG